MKLRTGTMLTLLLILPLRATSQFEGLVESTNTTVDELGVQQKYTMTMWLKGGWVRVGTSGTASLPGTTMIVRPDLHARWVLDDSSRSYFEVEVSDENPSPQAGAGRQSSAVRPTGKTRKILGYRCDEYRITHDEVSTELWGTKELAALQAAMHTAFGGGDEAEQTWASELEALGIFPMIATVRVDGVVMESHEVRKIEKRALPAELFALPDGYRKHNINDTLK
jgi:hypothetical protein